LIYIYFFQEAGMKMKNGRVGIALLVVTVTLLALAGCPKPVDPEPLSSDAALAAIALNGLPGEVPQAVPSTEWGNPLFDLDAMPYTHLFADSVTALANATITATPNGAGASVQYSRHTDSGPGAWNKTGQLSLLNEDYVYISVRSADGSTRNYYKAQVHDSGNIAGIVDVKINGKIAESPPEPYPNSAAALADAIANASWSANLVLGADNVDVRVEGTPANAYSLVQAAKVQAGSTAEPVWRDPVWEDTSWPQTELEEGKKVWADTSYFFEDGDYLAFKCVSPDGANTQYFAVRSVIPYITAISIGGTPGVIGIQGTAADNAAATDFNLASEVASDAAIVVTGVTQDVTVSYAKTASNAAVPSTFAPVTGFTADTFADGDEFYLKLSASGNPDRYLKYKLAVKSANAVLPDESVTVNSSTAAIGLLIAGPYGISGTPGMVTLSDAELSAAITVTVSNVSKPAGAAIAYGMATAGWGGALALPSDWNETGAMGIIASAEGKTIIIRVTAENGTTINYYGITLAKSGPPELSAFSVGGSPYPFVPGISVENLGVSATTLAGVSPGSVTLDATTAAGTIPFGGSVPAVNATLTVNTGTTYRIAQTKGSDPVENDWLGPTYPFGPDFAQPPAFGAISNNDVLWLKLTRLGTTLYYKIVVTVTE
jgi:hypothetical protein